MIFLMTLCKIQESACGVTVSTDSEAYIRNKAILYGANNPSLVLTPHQQKMNSASQSIALANPSLLNDRRKLMELARSKVDDDGYLYKHGKSRSKHLRSESDTSTSSDPKVKRTRTSEAERLQRIVYAEETMSDISKQIGFKEKRREQLTNIHNYGECEKVSEEISSLKRKRFELQAELTKLKRKQQQSAWYKHSKKQRKVSVGRVPSDQSDTDTNPPSTSTSVRSSRSTTPMASPFPPLSPTQLASSNGQLSHVEGEVIVLSEQDSTPGDTISKRCDTELLSDDSDSSTNL